MNDVEFWGAVIGAGQIIIPVIAFIIGYWLIKRKKKKEKQNG